MSNLFKRTIELSVYTSILEYRVNSLNDFFEPQDTLRVDFDVNMSWDPEPNTASFTIHNFNEKSRNTILNNYIGVRFAAGYGAGAEQIFLGNITNVRNTKIATGWETCIEAIDGGFNLLSPLTKTRDALIQNAYFAKSYVAGTPLQLIIADIAANVGLPFELGFIARNDTIIVATTYEGRTKKVLNRICSELNLQWSIQQGVLEISDKDAPIFSAMAQGVMLSPDTGLVGSPQLTIDEREKTTDPIGSISCTSLLNAKLYPKRPVMILPINPVGAAGVQLLKQNRLDHFTKYAKGAYVVKRARHYGSNVSGAFHTDIECPVWQV